MIIWIGGEVGLDDKDFESFRNIRNQIEKQFNAHFQKIGYDNKDLEELRLILVIRDDEYRGTQGGEEIKKKRGKKIYSRSPRIDYDVFKNANENQRKKLIWQTILESFKKLEEKKIDNLEVIEEYIEEQITRLN